MYKTAFLLLLLLALAGCGGTVAPSSNTPTPTPTPTGGGTTAPAPAKATTVSVAASQTTSGIDIVVSAPASATPPNVENMGAANQCPVNQSCNTGDAVHRGSSTQLLMFGPGLTADMTLSVDGPGDITFDTPLPTKSTSGTAGLTVSITVSPSAALGARTVILRAPNGDITTFTGGLEVVP